MFSMRLAGAPSPITIKVDPLPPRDWFIPRASCIQQKAFSLTGQILKQGLTPKGRVIKKSVCGRETKL